MRRYADKRMQEEQEMRDLVQQVAEGHKNSKAAKEKLQKLKQSIGTPPRYTSCESLTAFFPNFSFTVIISPHFLFPVKEVSEQSRELLRQALEEAQAELSRKFELIREIRAIESLPHIRLRNFDDTEVSVGLFGCYLTRLCRRS